MSKSLIFLTVGSLLAIAISFIKLSQYRNKEKRKKQKEEKKKQKKSKNQENPVSATTVQTELELHLPLKSKNSNNRDLYQNQIEQNNPYRLISKQPQLNHNIEHLHYTILLNLNKSKKYQGVIKIKITSTKNYLNQTNLYIDYLSGGILFLSVNGCRIEENEVIYTDHQICIKKQWLNKYENQVEIVFSSKYAFMGDGLTCYFPLDSANKYSLKGQVIYARNGLYKAARIIPCLGILNPCEIMLEILHPNGFNAQSNSNKILTKIATKKDYPLYGFLFEFGSNGLNTSRRLNNSATSEGSIKSTDEIIKVKSQFSVIKLSSIHDFFIFCSAVVEVRPLRSINSSLSLNLKKTKSLEQSNQAMRQILLRYFTKQHIHKKATSFLSMLQSQLREIFMKIEQHKNKNKKFSKYQGKIDIFFVDDVKAEGEFHAGAILLSQKTIERGIIDRRTQYLLCRAVIGMGYLSKRNRYLLTIPQIIKLNQLVLQIFPQCCDYIFVKNIQYRNIQNECVQLIDIEQQKQFHFEDNMLIWLHLYYEKQCRYLVKDILELRKRVSGGVGNIVDSLGIMDGEQYWTYFIARHPFVEVNVAEVLIKIGLKNKGPPTGHSQLKYAKQNFIKSKYYLSFLTLKQIQISLKTHLQNNSAKLHKILPFIKIKQSCLSLIPPFLQSYLPARQNRQDCEKLYQQFKKYNQSNNFHHISALSREIKRIKLFLSGTLKMEKRDIMCSLQSWKLLIKLGIYPEDQQTFNIVDRLQVIKNGRMVQQEHTAYFEQNEQIGDNDRFKQESTQDRKQDDSKLEAEVREIQRLLSVQMQK